MTTNETRDALVAKIDRLAEAGLCQRTIGGKHAFLKDIRDEIAAAMAAVQLVAKPVSREVAAEIDAALDLEELPPIRLPRKIAFYLGAVAKAEGVIVQALVREILVREFSQGPEVPTDRATLFELINQLAACHEDDSCPAVAWAREVLATQQEPK